MKSTQNGQNHENHPSIFNPQPATRRAFTLTELLVTIAIIGILAALILTVLGMASKRAKVAQSISNLTQVGKAFSGFATDYGGRLPWQLNGREKRVIFKELAGNANVGANFPVRAEHIFSVNEIKFDMGDAGILWSPCDPDRQADNELVRQDWPRWNPGNPIPGQAISWVLIEGADIARPTTILAATRNLQGDDIAGSQWVGADQLDPDTGEIPEHAMAMLNQGEGHYLLMDGSVATSRNADLDPDSEGGVLYTHRVATGGLTKGPASTRILRPRLAGVDYAAVVEPATKQETIPEPGSEIPPTTTRSAALTVLDYARISSYAYPGTTAAPTIGTHTLTWDSGEYVIYRDDNSDKHIVIGIAGTDPNNWADIDADLAILKDPFSIAFKKKQRYTSALEILRKFINEKTLQDYEITLVGHSLGGRIVYDLAKEDFAKDRVKAAYGFNPAVLTFLLIYFEKVKIEKWGVSREIKVPKTKLIGYSGNNKMHLHRANWDPASEGHTHVTEFQTNKTWDCGFSTSVHSIDYLIQLIEAGGK